MKKTIYISAIALTLFLLPTVILAQGDQQGQDNTQVQNQNQGPDQNQVQNQNQVQTQNEGEEEQLQIKTQVQENLKVKKEKATGSTNRSDNARQHMSVVATQVEALLADEERQGGIGQQVKEIAQQQKTAQPKIEDELDALDSRKGFMKKLFGPDYKAIKNLNHQMEQNQLRIQQLQELQNQVENLAEETQLQETIQVLENQNTALQEQVQAEEEITSLFGWLVKFFNK